MKTIKIFVLFAAISAAACRSSTKENIVTNIKKVDSKSLPEPVKKVPNFDNVEIYTLLQELIRNRVLDTSYGLSLKPESTCGLEQNEFKNLRKYLKIKTTEVNNSPKNKIIISEKYSGKLLPVQSDSTTKEIKINPVIIPHPLNFQMPITLTVHMEEQCLTNEDIKYMLSSKPNPNVFRWDNSRLGFDLDNHKNFYSLSIPLFSKDNKIALLKIEDLCPGLCGTGSTYVFRQKKLKWVYSSDAGYWYH